MLRSVLFLWVACRMRVSFLCSVMVSSLCIAVESALFCRDISCKRRLFSVIFNANFLFCFSRVSFFFSKWRMNSVLSALDVRCPVPELLCSVVICTFRNIALLLRCVLFPLAARDRTMLQFNVSALEVASACLRCEFAPVLLGGLTLTHAFSLPALMLGFNLVKADFDGLQ